MENIASSELVNSVYQSL